MPSEPYAVSPQLSSAAGPKILLHIDRFDENGVSGWAYDEAAPSRPVQLILKVDGAAAAEILCDIEVANLPPSIPSSKLGFKAMVPPHWRDGAPHRVELSAPGRSLTAPKSGLAGAEASGAGFAKTLQFSRYAVRGDVNGFSRGAIHGWVFVHDHVTGAAAVGQELIVRMNGRVIGQIKANELRPDVAQQFGCAPRCGFSFAPPQKLMSGVKAEFAFAHYPSGEALRNSPCKLAFPEMAIYDELRRLETDVDALFAKIWHLRASLRQINYAETYSLPRYDAWARAYFPALSALAGRLPLPRRPLVSLICPCFRPRLQDLAAAIQSVRRQSYDHWELIIIDDAGGDIAVSAVLAEAAAGDSRIRVGTSTVNLGISDASNVALGEARGEFIALFDHDDLLVDVALEVMVASALKTGAQVIYSDEDKIDDDGVYSEPHLKPDWNYRLLLSQNYICHFLMFSRSLLDSVGGFIAKYNGAQDHDLVLRLTENLPDAHILHVPEILYHWRKTPQSTAQSSGAKPYAIEAGKAAIRDHLARKNLVATVENIFETTIYSAVAQMGAPPSVTIIIPYHEKIELTRSCVEAIFATVDMTNVSIFLVDNWSTSEESHHFMEQMVRHPQISVIRIEEPFNFSRLNNIAAQYASSELLLFLNNDVTPTQPAWLNAMIGEFALDGQVAIVGNRLFYPNGTNQHAGVVLGVGGVADHAFKGFAPNDPGYFARASCSQNMSAVTAACMLIRKSVFDALGGFDEKELRVAFNDVDLCLRARAQGLKVSYCAASTAIHHESLSRGDDFAEDRQAEFFHEDTTMIERWGAEITTDPYYNAHFSQRTGMYRDLAEPTPSAFCLGLLGEAEG